MSSPTPAIQIENLSYAYGHAEAVHDVSLKVQPGRCYGLFGRNGAGKTTTMKCLLNLLRPRHGQVRVFGLDPAQADVAVKARLAYVPDQVVFYPWMSVRETLDYLASFRERWNQKTEEELLERFRLDPAQRTDALSKGQRTQVALIAAICPETDLLVLRTDVGPGPHRPARVHRDGDRRLPGGQSGQPRDSCLHAPHH